MPRQTRWRRSSSAPLPRCPAHQRIDFDAGGTAAQLFQDNYLSVSQNGAEPIFYDYRFVASSNTGVPSGNDLDNSGSVGGPNHAFGFGFFEGQFGMAVYSKYPIDYGRIRTFQNFLWKDMPGALLPDDPATDPPADWYSPDELDIFRLSSKSHWDVPIDIEGKTVHFLVSHPTPPVFDGPEDRNGTRNFDEIRFWAGLSPGIDFWAHIGGFVTGIVLGLFFGPRYEPRLMDTGRMGMQDTRPWAQVRTGVLLELAALILLAVLVVFNSA